LFGSEDGLLQDANSVRISIAASATRETAVSSFS
jgi:hypothetical protein